MPGKFNRQRFDFVDDIVASMDKIKNKSYEKSIDWIFIAKGIGIILVVIGHYTPTDYPIYWKNIKEVIYTFHMPLFFILSGYLYCEAKQTYKQLVVKKTKRLLLPYVSIALIFFFIKSSTGLFVQLQHPITRESILALALDPVHSYMPLLWFIHALFFIFLIYPLLKKYMKNELLIISMFFIINFIAGNNYMFFGNIVEYFAYFTTGILLKDSTILSKIESYKFYLFFLLSMFFVFFVRVGLDEYGYLGQYSIGVMGSLCIINVSFIISKVLRGKTKDIIEMIGFYSMSIYFFHTLFENFLFIAFIAIFSGVLFPLVLERFVLRKNIYTRKYLLGLTK